MHSSILLIFLSCALTALTAQTTLEGTVTDGSSGEPLSFVNVLLAGRQSYGVLTNERGEYRITLPAGSEHDTLLFSLLSYETGRFPINLLEVGKTRMDVRLQTSFIELDGVIVISDIGLRAFVKRAFDAIPQNYGSDDYLLRAFSRKYDVDDGEYTQVLEAMLTIRDEPYHLDVENPKVWIDQFRSTPYTGPELNFFWPKINRQFYLLASYDWFGNVARSKIRRPLGFFIFETAEASQAYSDKAGNDHRFMAGFTFANRGEYLSGNDTIVRIQYSIDPTIPGISKYATEASFNSGELLINKRNHAILRCRHGNDSEGWYTDVIYQEHEGKYYVKSLQHIIQYNYLAETRTHFSNRYLYVTEIITDKKAIRKAKKGKLMQASEPYTAIRVPYDVAFWTDNQMLQTIPAPEAMKIATEKMNAFEQDFLDNARRIKE